MADTYKICGEQQGQLAVSTDMKAVTAMAEVKFRVETVSVNVVQRMDDPKIVTRHEGPKPGIRVEKRAMLPTLFDKDRAATASNGSSMNDGHSVLLIGHERKAEELGPDSLGSNHLVRGGRNRFQQHEDFSVPVRVGVLKNANLTLQDGCPIKLNEAFATGCLAVEREFGPDRSLKSILLRLVSVA